MFLQNRMTMARTIKLYKLEAETDIPGLRPMTKTDVSQVCLHPKNPRMGSLQNLTL